MCLGVVDLASVP